MLILLISVTYMVSGLAVCKAIKLLFVKENELIYQNGQMTAVTSCTSLPSPGSMDHIVRQWLRNLEIEPIVGVTVAAFLTMWC